MNLLFVGDIVGRPGRRALEAHLGAVRRSHEIDFIVANGENAAGGFGITPRVAEDLFDAGIDILTTGNHVWDKKEALALLPKENRILRPLNYPPDTPGTGTLTMKSRRGTEICVVNLEGRVFMRPQDCPFRAVDQLLLSLDVPVIIVDFHAEATSEKLAMGRHLDGRVSAVVGTHTHVQTADERLLPGGTAYITDVGMTGPSESIIGVKSEIIIRRFLSGMPEKFETAKQFPQFQAVVIEIDPSTGRALAIERVSLVDSPPES